MDIIINPQVAYLLIFAGVMLLLIMFNDTKYSLPKVGAMAFCFLAGIAEFFILDGNPWAFLIVVLSPLPYFIAMRQERLHSPLLCSRSSCCRSDQPIFLWMRMVVRLPIWVLQEWFPSLAVCSSGSLFERRRTAGKAPADW